MTDIVYKDIGLYLHLRHHLLYWESRKNFTTLQHTRLLLLIADSNTDSYAGIKYESIGDIKRFKAFHCVFQPSWVRFFCFITLFTNWLINCSTKTHAMFTSSHAYCIRNSKQTPPSFQSMWTLNSTRQQHDQYLYEVFENHMTSFWNSMFFQTLEVAVILSMRAY